MMKMNRKKWLCGVAACLCLTGSTVPVFADTVTFNITIPGDIISKRSVKADDEQKFYVTGTKFSGSGKLYCKSRSGGSFRCYRKRYYCMRQQHLILQRFQKILQVQVLPIRATRCPGTNILCIVQQV